MTIKKILQKYPEDEVVDILTNTLGKPKEFLYVNTELRITSYELASFKKKYQRLQKGEPLAYILGFKYFYGLKFKVNKNVLIPRPETEELINKALRYIHNQRTSASVIPDKPRLWEARSGIHALNLNPGSRTFSQSRKFRDDKRRKSHVSSLTPSTYAQASADRQFSILDMATGSGCVAVSIASQLRVNELKGWQVTASDVSKKALVVAKRNAKHNLSTPTSPLLVRRGQGEVAFLQSDLFENIQGRFDLIIANLPYIPLTTYNLLLMEHPEKLRLRGATNLYFEPKSALTDGTDTYELYSKFFRQLPKHLNKNGVVLLEIDEHAKPALTKMIKKTLPKFKAKFSRDIRGFWRYLELKNP